MKTILPGEKSTAKTKNISIDGQLCSDEKKIADSFNCFFTSAVARLKQTLGIKSMESRGVFAPKTDRAIPDFKFKPVTETFVLDTIKRLKAGKTSGLDNISPRLLKDGSEFIAKALTRIINASLS